MTTTISRPALAGLAVVAVAVFAPIWFFGTLFGGLACDGDGGSPYAARDSTVGRLCTAREDGLGALWFAFALLTLAAMIVVCVVAVVRRIPRLVFIGLLVCTLLVGLYAGPFLVLDSNCSTADQQAYDQWARDPGRSPTPPADCETY